MGDSHREQQQQLEQQQQRMMELADSYKHKMHEMANSYEHKLQEAAKARVLGGACRCSAGLCCHPTDRLLLTDRIAAV